ncbi:hypothetical protein DAPPUDRAFT_326083 [Daphnia pulex]|uniref:Anaphase-promoting complex subunit 11 RING-H2 finger domain-containing protein n=1 Tax=Daphnia pulex TaxID=6669 RepID=E9H6N8_DAPPU|nr:hypothetical protein DAPPUDRAFT_326083 [Daphnia pulex]|eukprot:EFX72542.1 hypothetical protein DAPPUDRAFT_326083 [Daphnia pulex]
MADDIDMEKSVEKTTVGNDCVVKTEKMFSLKRWNAVAMWSWDVECEICAICRVQVMEMIWFSHFQLNTKGAIFKLSWEEIGVEQIIQRFEELKTSFD